MIQSAKLTRKLLIQISISILCFGGIAFYFFNHQEEFLLIKKFSAANIILILVLLTFNNTMHSYRTLLVLRNMGLKSISFFEWLKIFTVSRFINFYVVQGANLYRIAKLKKDFHFSYTRSISMTFFFTWLDINFLLFITMICVVILPRNDYDFMKTLFSLAGAFILCFCSPFLLKIIFRMIPDFHKGVSWVKAKLDALTDTFYSESKKVKLLGAYFILLTVFFLSLTFVMNICFSALGYNLGFTRCFLFALIFIISRTINITPGNFGLAEILCGYFSGFMGASIGSGIIVSGIIRVVNFIMLSLFTLFVNQPSVKKLFADKRMK